MSLLNQPVNNYGQLGAFFEKLREGTAPETFNRQHLKDIGFTSSNHHSFIPLLKGLGFISSTGVPTERYRHFLDDSRWSKVLAEAIKESYGDIFVIVSKPSSSDRTAIAGKYKSTYNCSANQADRNAKTFLALLALADEDTLYAKKPSSDTTGDLSGDDVADDQVPSDQTKGDPSKLGLQTGLHYNIQIHLPATKDIETYNAIFKSIREHLID